MFCNCKITSSNPKAFAQRFGSFPFEASQVHKAAKSKLLPTKSMSLLAFQQLFTVLLIFKEHFWLHCTFVFCTDNRLSFFFLLLISTLPIFLKSQLDIHWIASTILFLITVQYFSIFEAIFCTTHCYYCSSCFFKLYILKLFVSLHILMLLLHLCFPNGGRKKKKKKKKNPAISIQLYSVRASSVAPTSPQTGQSGWRGWGASRVNVGCKNSCLYEFNVALEYCKNYVAANARITE